MKQLPTHDQIEAAKQLLLDAGYFECCFWSIEDISSQMSEMGYEKDLATHEDLMAIKAKIEHRWFKYGDEYSNDMIQEEITDYAVENNWPEPKEV